MVEESKMKSTMSSFEEFMRVAQQSPGQFLPASNVTIPGIQLALTASIRGILSPFSAPSDEQEQFSKEVSNLVQDQAFLSEFSDQIGEPLEDESEDDFVERASDKLRQMLYSKFNIRF